MITLRPDTSEFRQKFGTILQQVKNPRALLAGVGREAGNLLKKHFRRKERTDANKLSDRRQHFWLKVSQTVSAPVVADKSVSVTIAHPAFAQKVFGGTILAKRAKNLTIPVSPDAYGRTTQTYERETGFKLFLLRANGKLLLARAIEGKGLQVEYLLTPRVNQKPDPTALPEEAAWTAALLGRAETILQRQLAQN